MKAIAEKASDYKYLLNVTASAAEVSQCLVDGIDNFLARVGARPLGENETIEDALVNRFGEDHAPEARANVVINSLLPLALNETGLLPACSPIPVDPAFPEAGKPYSFTAEVYVMPQLELENYDAPKAVVHKIRISGADVDRQLYALAAEFAVTEKDPETGIESESLPSITDEWVRDVFPDSEVNTTKELRAFVRTALEAAADQELEQEKVNAAVAVMGRRIQGDIPEEIVQILAADMLAQVQEDAINNGQILELALKEAGSSLEAYKAEIAEHARETVIENLVMDAIFRHFDMEITPADLELTLQGIASTAEPEYMEEALQNLRAMADSPAVLEVARRMKAGQWVAENAIITIA
ncbi:MAG: trigger factor [Eggerthellales bacterium]|nr:trigger factor [Eggerthellales bacterium]